MEALTPQQQAFEAQVTSSPTIKSLHDADKEIIDDLEGLKEGQIKLGSFVTEGFSKGKDRMDGLEDMFKDHINTTKENHRENMNAYNDLKVEIKDNKFKDIAGELKEKNKEIQVIKDRFWAVVKMVFNAFLGLIVGGLTVYFFK